MVKKTTTKKAKTKTAAKSKTKTKTAVKSKAKSKTAVKSKAKSKTTAKPKAKAKAKKAAAPKTKAKSKAAAPKTKAKSKAAVKPSARKSATADKMKKTAKKPSLSQREKIIQLIKQNLIAQKESLLKEAEETLSALPSELNFPDMGDQATAETDRNFMLRLRDRERMLLKKIEETIERIDSADYGICEECENEIGTKRLEARPVTTLCIDCKTRQEEEERIAEGG
jgi:DnaK suppressor protein